MVQGEDGARFEARVARNALAIAERELLLGPEIAAAHRHRLRDFGTGNDVALAAAIRAGDFDDGWEPLATALAASARTSCWWRTPPTCLKSAMRPQRAVRPLRPPGPTAAPAPPLRARPRWTRQPSRWRGCRCPGGPGRPAGCKPS